MTQRIVGQNVCPECGHAVVPRGPNMPRYCATCGHALVRETVAPFTAEPRAHGGAVTALWLGILGMFIPLCPPFSVVAILVGMHAISDIDEHRERYTGRGLATAAIVLGLIGLVLSLVICSGGC